MKKLICGFLIGAILVLTGNFCLQYYLQQEVGAEILANDQFWENRLRQQIDRAKVACAEELRSERQKWDQELQQERLKSFQEGKTLGRQSTEEKYKVLSKQQSKRFLAALDSLCRERDALQVKFDSVSQIGPAGQTKIGSLRVTGKKLSAYPQPDKKESSLIVAGTNPLLLTGYFIGSVILFVLIMLLVMRYRQRRRHGRFRL